MYFHSISRRTAIVLSVTMTCLVLVTVSLPEQQSTDSSEVGGRAAYAQIYDAFWRVDDKTDPTLMTATMYTPSVITALQKAGERTTTEDQILDLVQHQSNRDLRFLVTFDSINGTFSDENILRSLQLRIDADTVAAKDWKPIIGTSNVVNAPSGTASQKGIATFTVSHPIDWAKVQKIQLDVHGLPSAKNRSFVWSGAILLQATR